MYKIPDNFDFCVIQGKTINQIAFGSNVVVFYFDGGYIQSSGSFEYTYLGKTFEHTEIYPLSNDLGLLILLDKEITDVSYVVDDFILTFSNGHKLVLKGIDQYESYSICIGGRTVTI